MKKLFSFASALVFKDRQNLFLAFLAATIYMWLAPPSSFNAEVHQLAIAQTALQNRIFGVLFYISTAFICAFSVLLFCYDKSKLSVTFFTLLYFASVLDFSYIAVTGHHFNISEYIFFLSEFRQTGNAMLEYLPAAAKSFVWLVPGYVLLLLSKKWIVIRLRIGILKYLIFAVAVLMVSVSMSFSSGKRDNYITAPRMLGVAVYAEYASDHLGTKLPFTRRMLDPAVLPQARPSGNILMVIDESVSAQYLAINGYPHDTTPFLSDNPEKYINLGLAASAGNASNTANYILRNGLTPQNWPPSSLDTFDWPSIFSYAKRAGMRTIMIDSQQGASSLQNYMSNYDLADIDDLINLPRDSGMIYALDFEALDKVKELLETSDEPCFVLLVKMGIHFPYYLRYAPEEANFKPDYDKNSAVVDSMRYKGTPEGAERQLNSYLNGIAYSVDKYFEYLMDNFDLSRTSVIYTSDHGQSINSKTIQVSHNTWPQVADEQCVVPILLMGEAFERLFDGELADEYSAFQIFPSLLRLFGYSEEISQAYGPAFWESGWKRQSWIGPLFAPGGAIQPVTPSKAEISMPGEEFARPWSDK